MNVRIVDDVYLDLRSARDWYDEEWQRTSLLVHEWLDDM